MFFLVVFFFPLCIHLSPFSPHISPILPHPCFCCSSFSFSLHPVWFLSIISLICTSYPVNFDSCLLLPVCFFPPVLFQVLNFLLICTFQSIHSHPASYSVVSLSTFHFGLIKASCVFLCLRPSASDILRAGLLVLYFLLWVEPASRRDLPRLTALADSGWLHGPLQLRAFLPGPVVQRQPQRSCGVNTQTYR